MRAERLCKFGEMERLQEQTKNKAIVEGQMWSARERQSKAQERITGQRKEDKEPKKKTTKKKKTTEMEISLSPPQHKDPTWVTEKHSYSSLVPEIPASALCWHTADHACTTEYQNT